MRGEAHVVDGVVGEIFGLGETFCEDFSGLAFVRLVGVDLSSTFHPAFVELLEFGFVVLDVLLFRDEDIGDDLRGIFGAFEDAATGNFGYDIGIVRTPDHGCIHRSAFEGIGRVDGAGHLYQFDIARTHVTGIEQPDEEGVRGRHWRHGDFASAQVGYAVDAASSHNGVTAPAPIGLKHHLRLVLSKSFSFGGERIDRSPEQVDLTAFERIA